MLKLTITIEAKSESGLINSIDEVKRVIENGSRGGSDRNEDENYEFDITGEEEPETDEDYQSGLLYGVDNNQ